MYLSGKSAKINKDSLKWTLECGKVYKLGSEDVIIPLPNIVQGKIKLEFLVIILIVFVKKN